MKIYSTRHGQTDYNKQDIILGSTDLPLNDTGCQQAEKLAEDVKKLGDIDIIIASPMLRAQMNVFANGIMAYMRASHDIPKGLLKGSMNLL